MASGTSFKQQCPSCDAMVPIRDSGLIGKKIDCPKCKYRFVVEEPAIDDEDDAPASRKKGDSKGIKAAAKAGPRRRSDDDDDGMETRKKKKSGGGSAMLIIGGGLGLAGVVAIIVCAILFLGGDDPPTASGPTQNMPPPPVAGADPAEGEGDLAPGAPAAEKKDPPSASILANVSNLLPNDSQAVVAYPMPVTLGSSLRAAATSEAEGGFRTQRFRQIMTVDLEDLQRVISAVNFTDDWLFTIVQSKRPFIPDVVKQTLNLTDLPKVRGKSGKMHDVFVTNRELDALSNLLFKLNKPRESMQVYFVDQNTLVFADPKPMQKFLADDAKPEYLTKDTPAGDDLVGGAAGIGGPGGAAGIGGPPGGPIGMGGVGTGGPPGIGGPPGTGMGPGGPGLGGLGGAAPASDVIIPTSWMTVDPSLKLMLDRIEKLEENKTSRRHEPASLVTMAGLVDHAGPLVSSLTSSLNVILKENGVDPLTQRLVEKSVSAELKLIKTLGASLVAFDQRRGDATIAVEYHDRRRADSFERQFRPLLPTILPYFKEALALNLEIGVPQRFNPAAGFGGFTGGYGGAGSYGSGTSGPGGMGAPPSPGGMGMPPGPGGMGMPPGPGGMGAPPGPGGMGLGGGPGGVGIGGTAGGFGRGPGFGGANQTPEDPDGKLTLSREDRMLVLTLECQMPAETYKKLFPIAKEGLQLIKAQAELATTRSQIHELASALAAYVNEKGQFPQGALPRPPSAERGFPWRPDQRLSWAVELLPYLGEDYADWRIDRTQGWNDENNSMVARRVVPALVAHQTPGTGAIRIEYPGEQGLPFGATHFVGIAGLGMDAASYSAEDAAHAKKLGVFGYDRVTKKADVKDGLGNTIALLMVPGDHKSPWLAGGGATVRAVSEDPNDAKPIAPFVCTVFPEIQGEASKLTGKKGTIAIMGDGKVRFIPEDLPADTFRALCTIAGGEPVQGLDRLCPELPAPEKREIRAETLPDLKPTDTSPPINVTWSEFSPKSKAYTVRMPGKATEQSLDQVLPDGTSVTITLAIAQYGSAEAGCTVAEVKAPSPDAAKQIMAAALAQSTAALGAGAEIKEKKEVKLGTHSGTEYLFAVPTKGNVRIRLFLVGSTIYQTQAGPTPPIPDRDVSDFLDSFKLGS